MQVLATMRRSEKTGAETPLGVLTPTSVKLAPTARDYVQDGLIAMWDGIENAGWGVHDATATVWKDLAGTLDLTITTAATVAADSLVCAGSSAYSNDVISPVALELVWQGTGSSRDSIMINFPNVLYAWYGGGYSPKGSQNYTTADLTWGERYSCSGDVVNGTTRTFVSVGGGTFGRRSRVVIGNRDLNTTSTSTNSFNGRVYCVRAYNRALTAAEIAANYAIDRARFNLPTEGGAI